MQLKISISFMSSRVAVTGLYVLGESYCAQRFSVSCGLGTSRSHDFMITIVVVCFGLATARA